MQCLVLLFAAGALLCTCGCHAANANRKIDSLPAVLDVDNALEPHSLQTKRNGLKKFVKIIHRPPAMVKLTGVGELVCVAMGSPAPSVQWLKNNEPLVSHNQESNEMISSSPASIARVSATLLVRPSHNPVDVYTCIVTAGHKTDRASSSVYTIDNNSDLSERYKLQPFEPKILVYYEVFMDTIGNTATLPCKARGRPRPRVTWKDNNGVDVRTHPRMKVLRSGELVISPLQWADMGEFSCLAHGPGGVDSANTFVYPVAG